MVPGLETLSSSSSTISPLLLQIVLRFPGLSSTFFLLLLFLRLFFSPPPSRNAIELQLRKLTLKPFMLIEHIRPLPTQRVPPLNYFEISIFGGRTPKFFKVRHCRQYILILRGSARRINAIFWSKISKKCLKTIFLTCFFQNIACGAENGAKTGSF